MVAASTIAFTACFMIWMMFAVIGIPVRTGSLIRLPLGMWTDKFGAHTITWWVSLACLFFLSYPQTEFTVITVTGRFAYHIGLGTTIFTMGIAFAIDKASA